MKKSIFKASFEESLNLLDDASLQYIKKDYYEKLGKGLNNGKPSIGFRIKSILYSVLNGFWRELSPCLICLFFERCRSKRFNVTGSQAVPVDP